MSNRKRMKNLDKLDKLLRQNPQGIRITEAARKLDVSRSTIYDWLNSKELQGRAYYQRGIAYSEKPSETETSPIWKKQFFEHKDLIMKAIANQDPDDLVKTPQAALNFLKADLPSEVKERLPELKALEDQIARVFRQKYADWYSTQVYRNRLLIRIALNFVPQVFGKAQDLVLKS